MSTPRWQPTACQWALTCSISRAAMPRRRYAGCTNTAQTVPRRKLDGFTTSLDADVDALARGRRDLAVRRRLALEFRVGQKRGLRDALHALGRESDKGPGVV